MNRWKQFWNDVERELKENKNTFMVYSGLRLLIILMMVLQLFNKNYENVFLCMLSLLLMIVPSVIQATFKVEFPSFLEIIILIFIFAAEILGEISSFYIIFPYWDTVLHTINGFICAALGFSLVDILNRDQRMHFELSPLFMAIVAFCFSMTIGVLWEFFEYGMDTIFQLDMQKDTWITTISSVSLDPTNTNQRVILDHIQNVVVDGVPLAGTGYLDIGLIDTMEDLIVNFMGAFTFSVLGYFYVKYRNQKSIVAGLIPEPWAKNKKRTKYLKSESKKKTKDN